MERMKQQVASIGSTMVPDVVIVRFGEMMLKGRNRHRFVRSVHRQIETALTPCPKVVIQEEHGRLYIQLNGEPFHQVAEGLDKVFGIANYSPAWTTELDIDLIKTAAVRLIEAAEPQPATFKVSARRANKQFPYDSQEIGREVGGYVLHTAGGGLRVDVHSPDMEIRVEIREQHAYVFTAIIEGNRGYPLGSNGKALLMLSGGIDSPVAGWLGMRRGLELEAVHFHSYPYTSERAKQKVIELARILSQYSNPFTVHLVSFTEIQTKLKEQCPESLLITIMRRIMLRICDRLAEPRRALAIVTGDNLGQVASQTLPSLNVIGRATELPILRPLITMDKLDIIRHAEQIGTYSTSILPYEDCCTIFLPKSPSTNPALSHVEEAEGSMEWLKEEIDRAVSSIETINVRWQDKDNLDEYF
ncbi:tRNA uracil 4-sulfurtransferase ThiI [Paenibacillus sp. J2TS4]|uniref:tRNA uracil 4-sulfurtransferase ThiI n=1 Tax=Paenibacillus sp. J2TS4 TaxID=2807194 RepID=UPI001B2D7DB6|nr:tRNA uracil 4-sulfurtransferase ThiI [Paenibacillus sp. J2TS4]GIP35809.1 putative tRNA sulfurtransferase [Paenibacillus sp. J2TS4]